MDSYLIFDINGLRISCTVLCSKNTLMTLIITFLTSVLILYEINLCNIYLLV